MTITEKELNLAYQLGVIEGMIEDGETRLAKEERLAFRAILAATIGLNSFLSLLVLTYAIESREWVIVATAVISLLMMVRVGVVIARSYWRDG